MTGRKFPGSFIERSQKFPVNFQRRALLEEAAGITGLHSRRHEAQLRLRAAETNIERLDDILTTLKDQLKQLKKQIKNLKNRKKPLKT